jgi:hypothetical protein
VACRRATHAEREIRFCVGSHRIQASRKPARSLAEERARHFLGIAEIDDAHADRDEQRPPRGTGFTELIPKGTPLPASVTETFTTADHNQPSIQITPVWRTVRNRRLGTFDVTEIPPAGPPEPVIAVTFHVDAAGAFSLMARDTHNRARPARAKALMTACGPSRR